MLYEKKKHQTDLNQQRNLCVLINRVKPEEEEHSLPDSICCPLMRPQYV